MLSPAQAARALYVDFNCLATPSSFCAIASTPLRYEQRVRGGTDMAFGVPSLQPTPSPASRRRAIQSLVPVSSRSIGDGSPV